MNGRDFDTIYAGVPAEQKRLLQDFRATHPQKAITIDTARWRYLGCGYGDHALLFLPGAFSPGDMWFHSILRLEKDYRIIAPDSFVLQGVCDMDAVCRALVQILTAEGFEKATLVGLSAGGGVAQYFIQMYPEMVEHLVLTHTGVYGSSSRRTVGLIALLVRILPVSLVRRILLKQLGGHYPESSQWLAFTEAYYQELGGNLSKDGLYRFMVAARDASSDFAFAPDVIASWPGRILILNSRDDAVTLDKLDVLKARYPQARIHLFEEGGHHTFLLFPELYTDTLQAFLDSAYGRSESAAT